MSSSLIYSIVSDLLPEGSCRVTSVRIVEELNRPFVAEIQLAVDDPELDLTALPGSDLSLLISRDPDERLVCGLVADVHDSHFEREGRPARLLLMPALALLELRRNTRMFQEKTVPEILETVLGESLGAYGRACRLELQETYPR